jgi:hypothetical protein
MQLRYWRGIPAPGRRCACAQTLVGVADCYGIPILEIKPLGVLENDTPDSENAGENGATATLFCGAGLGMTAHNETPLVEYAIRRRALVNSTLPSGQQQECILLPTHSWVRPTPFDTPAT